MLYYVRSNPIKNNNIHLNGGLIMPSMKIFEQKCFDALKNSEAKAKEFEGPIGQNIITIPVRNKAQFEYCVANGIEVFEREIRVNDGYIRHFYFFYITFEQAANIAMP